MPKSRKKIRVLICNKYTLFREGMKAVLRNRTPIEIVGEASSAREAIGQLERLKPDVVLLEESSLDLTGYEATQRIKTIAPDVKVLILTMHDDESLMARCLEAGAAGWVRTDERGTHLPAAIHAVYRRREHRASRAAVA